MGFKQSEHDASAGCWSFQSLFLWTCTSGHHIHFWCWYIFWQWKLYLPVFPVLNARRVNELNDPSWMVDDWVSDSFWLKSVAVITGGACFDLPWISWILTLEQNEDHRWLLCGRVLLQPNRFHSCCHPVPKVVPKGCPCIGNFRFDRPLTWRNFGCRGQAGGPS